jgi:CDP-glucose 4,6-dehydratase
MEGLGVSRSFWQGKRVLVTGHTGFKGSWLAFWLSELGADVTGIGLAPPAGPSLYELLGIAERCRSHIADINDPAVLPEIMAAVQPDLVIHMAAQALVRPSYSDPVGTYETNVMGTVRLLDALRRTDSVRSAVIVTSDKCYDNREQIWGYRETDPLGGHDPYSSSKGAAEIAAQSMQRSFFQPFVPNGHPARIATVRAGNVIGGGDWSQDRLVPDIIRGLLGPEGHVTLRSPRAIRPWQHVLEPVAFYLDLARRLFEAPDGIDQAWNIGPAPEDTRTVISVAEAMRDALGKGEVRISAATQDLHEATLLTLDCTKARTRLGWQPVTRFETCVDWTASWYAAWADGADMTAFTRQQIATFEALGTRQTDRTAP